MHEIRNPLNKISESGGGGVVVVRDYTGAITRTVGCLTDPDCWSVSAMNTEQSREQGEIKLRPATVSNSSASSVNGHS